MSEPEEREDIGLSTSCAGPPPLQKQGRIPRWTIPFLRALERTGDVRASAEDAGIDHTTAYARRRAHADFAAEWERALAAHRQAKIRAEAGKLGALMIRPDAPSPSHSCAVGPSLSREGRGASGEDLIGGGAQLKQAGHDRWGPRKEKAFFDELAATANVKRAAKAAGVSPNAVYQRRLRDAHFKAKWAAVLETGRASIEMRLVEAANRSFEPEDLDTGDVPPKVSVAEAIRIAQAQGSKAQRDEVRNPFAEQAASMSASEVEELRERILNKLQRLKERDRKEQLAEGWSYDEAHDHMVPPGWVRAAG